MRIQMTGGGFETLETEKHISFVHQAAAADHLWVGEAYLDRADISELILRLICWYGSGSFQSPFSLDTSQDTVHEETPTIVEEEVFDAP